MFEMKTHDSTWKVIGCVQASPPPHPTFGIEYIFLWKKCERCQLIAWLVKINKNVQYREEGENDEWKDRHSREKGAL